MRLTIESTKSKEMPFFIAYGIFLLFGILSQSFYYKYFMSAHKFIILGCCVILVLHELQYTRTTKKGLIGLSICVLMFLITFSVSNGANQNTVPALFLFVYASRNIKFDKIARFTLGITSVLLAFVILSGYLGIIDDYTITNYVDGVARVRHYLGFRYALFPSTILFNLTCIVIYIKKERIKLWHVGVLFLANYLIYVQTNSRLTFYLAILILVAGYLLRFGSEFIQKRKALLWIGSLSYIIFFVLSLYLTITYNASNPTLRELNSFLGNRLRLGQTSIGLYGISIFPNNNTQWIGAGLDAYGNRSTLQYSYVDSLYIQALQHYGIIFMLIFLVVMTMLMFKIRDKDIYLYVIMFAIAAHYVIDDLQWYLHYNTFWFAIGYVLIGTVVSFNERQKSKKGLPATKRKRAFIR